MYAAAQYYRVENGTQMTHLYLCRQIGQFGLKSGIRRSLMISALQFFERGQHQTHYLRRPFHGKGITTEFSGATVDFPFTRLIAEGAVPS